MLLQSVPKNLQHCLQRAMEDYLAMKKVIRRYVDDTPLIAVLESSDIEAFGGECHFKRTRSLSR